MLRSLVNTVTTTQSPNLSAGFLQLVRWRRKPRWLPTAKSKLFRVPERVPEDPAERSELMRLHANYKTQLRAVRGYLMEEAKEREATSTSDHVIITPEQMEEEWKLCSQLNDTWNAEIAEIRNKRLQAERQAQAELIMERLEAKKERVTSRLQRAEELVRLEKERAKSLITPANIDAAIEAALADTKDYDFAIDLSGRVLRESSGQEPSPKQ